MKESEVKASEEIHVYENNNSIWGLVINSALKNADNQINHYRYRSISTRVNDVDVPIAEGIWNEPETSEVIRKIKDNTPDSLDYNESLSNDHKIITFNCDKKVFTYLVENKIFIEKFHPKINTKLMVPYPPIFGEKRPALNVAVESSKSELSPDTHLQINIHVLSGKLRLL